MSIQPSFMGGGPEARMFIEQAQPMGIPHRKTAEWFSQKLMISVKV
jgi:hypothetical protein